jgi:hypothetical protein
MKKYLLAICLSCCIKSFAQQPVTFIIDADHLEKVKKKVAEKDNATPVERIPMSSRLTMNFCNFIQRRRLRAEDFQIAPHRQAVFVIG